MNDAVEAAAERVDTEKLKIEREKLELERYKAQLDYKKFVLGSVFVAVAIAAIPPLFQLATAALEYTKSNAERQAKQQAFRDDYIKDFVSNALNQDIELRIRFAQYFARVSTEPYRNDWVAYLDDLRGTRADIRAQIDKMEAELAVRASAKERDEVEVARLNRNLDWAYAEVGYVARDRSAAANPRVSENDPRGGFTAPLVMGRFSDPTYYLLKQISWSPRPEAGQSAMFEAISVPAGYVITFDSIPRIYWSFLRPDGSFAQASIIHDYLYWTQSRPRSEADEIFKLAMQDLGVDPKIVSTLYTAVRASGQNAWNENAKLKATGEKRILKVFPTDPKITWGEWKKRADVFTVPSPL